MKLILAQMNKIIPKTNNNNKNFKDPKVVNSIK